MANRDARLNYMQTYNTANRETINGKMRKRRSNEKYRDKERARWRLYYSSHREKINERRRMRMKAKREAMMQQQNSADAVAGRTAPPFLATLALTPLEPSK